MAIRQYSRVEVLKNPYGLQLFSRTGTVVWGDVWEQYTIRLDHPALGNNEYGEPTLYSEIKEPEKNLRVIAEPPCRQEQYV
jgi:hypothetical protein